MTFVRPLFLVVSLMSLTACGGGGGDDASSAPTSPGIDLPTSPGTDIPMSSGDVPETLLDGVWESDCLPAAPPASSRRLVVQVTDSVYSFADTTYGDSICGEESAQREIDTRGTFVEQIPESGRDIADGIPIDLSVDEVILIARQSTVTNLYTEQMLCGITRWATNFRQDIGGCDDETGTIESNTTVGRTDFNIFLVDDASTPDTRADDTLLLGTVNSVTDPERRPEMVDQSLPFSRRPGSLARPL